MNWKLRLQNPNVAVPLLVCVIGFIYQALAVVGVTPSIMENDLYNAVSAIALFILGTGIITDPTTKGFFDSLAALGYDKPKDKSDDEDKMMMMTGDVVLKDEKEQASQSKEADLDESDGE